MKYRLCEYDLWNDPEGGKSVNDVYVTSIIWDIPENILENDRKLISFLKKEGQIKSNIRYASITIDGENEHTLYFNYKCDPAFELRRVED